MKQKYRNTKNWYDSFTNRDGAAVRMSTDGDGNVRREVPQKTLLFSQSQNTPLFLKEKSSCAKAMEENGNRKRKLRCRRSAFSREKNFSPSPISQRFSNKKKRRGGGSFGEKLWRRLRRGVGQCQQSFLITLLNISQKLNFSRAIIEKYWKIINFLL